MLPCDSIAKVDAVVQFLAEEVVETHVLSESLAVQNQPVIKTLFVHVGVSRMVFPIDHEFIIPVVDFFSFTLLLQEYFSYDMFLDLV